MKIVNFQFSLKLAPVFVEAGKLIENNGPVLDRLRPFFSNLSQSQENRLFHCIVIWKRSLTFRVLPDFAIEVFNQIGRVDDLSDLQRKIKEDS